MKSTKALAFSVMVVLCLALPTSVGAERFSPRVNRLRPKGRRLSPKELFLLLQNNNFPEVTSIRGKETKEEDAKLAKTVKESKLAEPGYFSSGYRVVVVVADEFTYGRLSEFADKIVDKALKYQGSFSQQYKHYVFVLFALKSSEAEVRYVSANEKQKRALEYVGPAATGLLRGRKDDKVGIALWQMLLISGEIILNDATMPITNSARDLVSSTTFFSRDLDASASVIDGTNSGYSIDEPTTYTHTNGTLVSVLVATSLMAGASAVGYLASRKIPKQKRSGRGKENEAPAKRRQGSAPKHASYSRRVSRQAKGTKKEQKPRARRTSKAKSQEGDEDAAAKHI